MVSRPVDPRLSKPRRGGLLSKYATFAELLRHERPGRDFRIVETVRARSPVLILAPHGGEIEAGTSQIAELIAGTDHSLFCFEGLKLDGLSRDLHITSHRFDLPACLALAAAHEVVVSVHGCRGSAQIFLGGLDAALARLAAARLGAAGFDVVSDGHRYPGRHPLNICNRGARRRGLQLEVTHDLRGGTHRAGIAAAVRAAIAAHLASPA